MRPVIMGLIVVAMISPLSWGAISQNAGMNSNASSSSIASLQCLSGITVSANDLLFIAAMENVNATMTASDVSGLGSSWTPVAPKESPSGNQFSQLFYTYATTGGTFTGQVSFSINSSFSRIYCVAATGFGGIPTIDQTAVSSITTGTNPVSPNITPSTSASFAISFVNANSSVTPAANAPWAQLTSARTLFDGESQVLSSNAAVGGSFISTSSTYICRVVNFMVTPSPPATSHSRARVF